MPSLRLCTFNVENLLMRCDFSAAGIAGTARKLTAVSDAATAERVDRIFNVLSEDDRTLTAQALAAANADVCAVQEVENLVTLTAFHNRYLSRWSTEPYEERILYEGNDGRGIDVGLLSRAPILRHTSHAGESYGSLGLKPPKGSDTRARIFRRDCLEVDVEKDGRALTLFVCHFKSMHGGRRQTRSVRQLEAAAVRKLIERRFRAPATADWVILGDLNDYFELDGRPVTDHGLGPLIDDGFAIDLAAQVVADPLERWSHHYPAEKQYAALDHMLLSPSLAAQNAKTKAAFLRAGLPWRSQRHRGRRLPGIGWSNPKASDHCPLVATIEFVGQEIRD